MRFSGVATPSLASLAAVVSCSLLTFGCGSTKTAAPGGDTTQDPGVAGPGKAVVGHDSSPQGVAYPTNNIGYTPRSGPEVGSKPGNVIRNYKFLGYPESDSTKGLQPVALADYFDPEGKNYKIIHIIVSGVWCTYCKMETDALVPQIPDLKAQKVVFLTALSEDSNHNPAQQSDLDFWVKSHKTNFTQVLDPGNQQLGPFFDAAAIPWNANIDARTMEILSASVGAPPDILTDVQPWLDWVARNPIKN